MSLCDWLDTRWLNDTWRVVIGEGKGPCGEADTTPDCTKDLMAMRKCLKSKKV